MRHPIVLEDGPHALSTIGTFEMTVALPANVKGTHMSRFIALLHEAHPARFSLATMPSWLDRIATHLESAKSFLQVSATFLLEKEAPVTKTKSYLDYGVELSGQLDAHDSLIELTVSVPVTSLCPCSKKIAEYGAHNQRSIVRLSVQLANPHAPVSIEEMIRLVESEASCELYGLLKRPDEKLVTERAYENPKFVEDMVRDIAARLNQDSRIAGYRVHSENFESIHNHSAFAEIQHNYRA